MLWWTLRQLRSKNAPTRARAIVKLSGAKRPQAVDALIEILGAFREPHEVRAAAADALGGIGDRRALDPLMRALLDGMDGRITSSAGTALLRMRDERSVPALVKAFAHVDDEVNRTAAAVLVSMGGPRVREELLRALESPGPGVRVLAAIALGLMGEAQGAEFLVAAVLDPGTYIEVYALRDALAEIQDLRAVEPLGALLRDDDANVRSRAATALGGLKGPRTVELLVVALRDEDVWVRSAAAAALGEIRDARAVEPLAAALGNTIEAEKALERIGGPEAELALSKRRARQE